MGIVVSVFINIIEFIVDLIVNIILFIAWLILIPFWLLFWVITCGGRCCAGGVGPPKWGYKYERRHYFGGA